MTENPFASPASQRLTWAEHQGHLLLIEPHGVRQDVPTAFGPKDAVEADVTVLDPAPVTVYTDTLVFPMALMAAIKNKLGQKILARLVTGQAKAGQKPPWLLEEPSDMDVEVGKAYLLSRKGGDQDPFQTEVPF